MKGPYHPDVLNVSGACAPPGITDDSPLHGCCMGEAVYGPTRCTCWVPELDALPTAPLDRSLSPGTRKKRCVDCAYSKGSPERASGEGEDLEAMALDPEGHKVFWCHQGMAKVKGWRHADGTFWPHLGRDHYVPLIEDSVPYRLDGRPGERCAGWAALRPGNAVPSPVGSRVAVGRHSGPVSYVRLGAVMKGFHRERAVVESYASESAGSNPALPPGGDSLGR